jgi:magnesium-transporting ATPase (P-type)
MSSLAAAPTKARGGPHAATVDDVVRELRSDLDLGLGSDDAAVRLADVGPNRLPTPDRPAYGAIALRQLADPLVALLLAAAAVSVMIGEALEATAIGARSSSRSSSPRTSARSSSSASPCSAASELR